MRVERGSNPPASCNAEVYEAPPNWPGSPGIRGIDVDTNGVAWVNLVVADAIGSFDRRRCATLNGPAAATGQHCPEGWTFYPIPGPTMQGTPYKAESTYLMTIDRQDVLGLGKNTPIAYADNSDSMLALRPVTGEWVRLRIPYPLGFLGRVIDPRIDDGGFIQMEPTAGAPATERTARWRRPRPDQSRALVSCTCQTGSS